LEEGWEIEIPSVALFSDCTDFVELVEEDGISKLRTVACMYMAKRNEMKQKTRINDKDRRSEARSHQHNYKNERINLSFRTNNHR